MIVVSGRKTVLKQGNRVPLVTGSVSTSGGAQTQVQYLDVGLNIDASIEESTDGVKLNTAFEQSSIAEGKSGFGTQDPIVRQAKLEGTSILTAGKPTAASANSQEQCTRAWLRRKAQPARSNFDSHRPYHCRSRSPAYLHSL
jgi:hypothetical protein